MGAELTTHYEEGASGKTKGRTGKTELMSGERHSKRTALVEGNHWLKDSVVELLEIRTCSRDDPGRFFMWPGYIFQGAGTRDMEELNILQSCSSIFTEISLALSSGTRRSWPAAPAATTDRSSRRGGG